MTEVSVVIPAYNEAENLKVILPRLKRVLDSLKTGYEVLIIDTREKKDDTEEVCGRNGVRCIKRENGDLYGDAIRTGFKYAEGRYLVVMDADGSHDPADIRKMFRCMKSGRYDLVIGSRYCKGGSTDNNIILLLMSWVLNVTYRIMFGLRVKDVSDSFRMYRTEQLKKLSFECDNFDIVEEILIKLNYGNKHFRAKEIPIHFNKRSSGESKRDLFKFILSYISTMKRLMRVKRSCRNGRTGDTL